MNEMLEKKYSLVYMIYKNSQDGTKKPYQAAQILASSLYGESIDLTKNFSLLSIRDFVSSLQKTLNKKETRNFVTD